MIVIVLEKNDYYPDIVSDSWNAETSLLGEEGGCFCLKK